MTKHIKLYEDFVNQEYLDNNQDFYLSNIPKKHTTYIELSKEQEFLKNIQVSDISFSFKGKKSSDKDMNIYNIEIKNAPKEALDLFDNLTIHLQNENKVITKEGRLGNRFHILDIGEKVKGLGVGMKIYLKAIEYFGYISSDSMQSTTSAKRVWNKLIQIEGYNHIFYNGTIRKLSCEKCNGKKYVVCPQCKGYDPKCSYCGGTGKIDCDKCNEEFRSQFVFIGNRSNLLPVLEKLNSCGQIEISNIKTDL